MRNPLEAFRKFAYGVVGSVALLANVATILGYIKIDPADATDAAARAFWLVAPAVTFVCGCVAGWGFTRQHYVRRKSDADNRLRRFCLTFSPRKRAIVLEALEAGDLRLSTFDQDALSLCDGNVLKTSPIGGVLSGATFFVNPEHVETLRSHGAEWLGSMGAEERRRLVYGNRDGEGLW